LLDRVLSLGGVSALASGGEGPLLLESFPAPVINGTDANPAVTVLMPARNLEDHIAMAIASLRAQTLANWELLIVDDASTDNTAERAEAAAGGDPRIRVLRNAQQLGAFGSRNRALNSARGRYVTVLDGDDFAHSQRLETHVRILETGKHRAVASLLLRVDTEGRIVAPRIFPMARRNYSSFMIGTELARQLGGYDDVPVGGDSAMFWRVQAKIGRKALLRLNQVDTFALQREASLTAAADTGIGNREALAARIAYHERIMRQLAGT
jgi:glycosyltransferase involved in cell wall biosynthesis